MQPSKIIALSCLLLFSLLTTAQEYQLNGRVSIFNSRVENGPIKYVKDAKISNELSPTRITDYKGRIELNFFDVDPSSTINLRVEKAGYEVVNKAELENIQISKNPSIRIFLAKEGTIEKIENKLFKFSLRNISERRDSIFQLLNLSAVSDDKILEELESNFGQKISDEMEAKLLLNQAIKDLEKELPSLTHQIATINLDFASDRYKNAFKFFQKNQIKQAIKILDEKELDTSFENILSSIEQAKETPASYRKILDIRTVQAENVIESFKLKRTLLKIAFRFVEAEDLTEKIVQMKSLIQQENQPEILMDENQSADFVEKNQDVNILLEDTLHLALIDTNWVELELDKLVSAKGGEEEIMTGDPKAKTILEILPSHSDLSDLGMDFENTLFVKKDAKPYAIPIYEQPTPVFISTEKVINTSPSVPVETSTEQEWLVFSDVEQPDVSVNFTPASAPEIDVKNTAPAEEEIVFIDIVEPNNYQTYKITTKTSLRQQATAASKVLKRLKVGSEVQVIDQVDRYWCKVLLNGKIGYVKVLLLEKVK